MHLNKENFLRTQLVPLLQRVPAGTIPRWGKMTFHHMVEHLADVWKVANGSIRLELLTPPEKLPALREFLMSELPFRENTKSQALPEGLLPLRTHTVQAAIGYLQQEIIHFFELFKDNQSLKTLHPVFGELDFSENVQCLYKHCQHHLKQFAAV